MTGPWHEAVPELGIAAVMVLATAVAAYLMASWTGLAVVTIGTAASALVVMRGLLPLRPPDAYARARSKPTARPVTGYSHRKFLVESAISNRGFYHAELRTVLEHLLAARLAERHGVNLYQDPAAARRLFCEYPRDSELWVWLDPATPASKDSGIPRRILTRIIDRLEQL